MSAHNKLDINKLLREYGDDVVRETLDRAQPYRQDDGDVRRERLAEQPHGGNSPTPDSDPQEESTCGAPHKTRTTLDNVIEAFDKWLKLRDHTPVYVVLGTIAANILPGDPVWLGLIAPPSSAKTEILNALSRLPHTEPVATLTPAALLSGTPKKQREHGARGGLLRQIGEFGFLVLKDFGSILSMRPDAKAETLAALREIYDGAWSRHLGTDGGKTLSWSGKLGLVFGTTEVYDDHYGIIGSLGDRFLLCRIASSYAGQLHKALDHTGRKNKQMRDELADVVAKLFENELREPPSLSDDEEKHLDKIVAPAVRLRAHVTRDRYSREIENIHGAEGPGRLVLTLERLFMGLVAIGLARDKALQIIEDVTLASTPPIRRRAFELLTKTPTPTRDIAKALKLPTTTTRRALEELTAQGLAVRTRGKKSDGKEKEGGADLWHIDPDWAEGNGEPQTAHDGNGYDAGGNVAPGTGLQGASDTPGGTGGTGAQGCNVAPAYEVLGPTPDETQCTLCGKSGDVKRIRHGGGVRAWHEDCADEYLEMDQKCLELDQVLREWKAAFGIDRQITIDALIGRADLNNGLRAVLLAVAALDDGLTVSNSVGPLATSPQRVHHRPPIPTVRRG